MYSFVLKICFKFLYQLELLKDHVQIFKLIQIIIILARNMSYLYRIFFLNRYLPLGV